VLIKTHFALTLTIHKDVGDTDNCDHVTELCRIWLQCFEPFTCLCY